MNWERYQFVSSDSRHFISIDWLRFPGSLPQNINLSIRGLPENWHRGANKWPLEIWGEIERKALCSRIDRGFFFFVLLRNEFRKLRRKISIRPRAQFRFCSPGRKSLWILVWLVFCPSERKKRDNKQQNSRFLRTFFPSLSGRFDKQRNYQPCEGKIDSDEHERTSIWHGSLELWNYHRWCIVSN